MNSKQRFELLDREARIPHDGGHGVSVHRIVAGDDHVPLALGHEYVPALAIHTESGLLQGIYGSQVINPGKLGHESVGRHLQFPNLTAQLRLPVKLQITLYRIPDVFQRLLHCCSLRVATGQLRTTCRHSFSMNQERYMESPFHEV